MFVGFTSHDRETEIVGGCWRDIRCHVGERTMGMQQLQVWAWEFSLLWAEANQRLIWRSRACKNTSSHTCTHTRLHAGVCVLVTHISSGDPTINSGCRWCFASASVFQRQKLLQACSSVHTSLCVFFHAHSSAHFHSCTFLLFAGLPMHFYLCMDEHAPSCAYVYLTVDQLTALRGEQQSRAHRHILHMRVSWPRCEHAHTCRGCGGSFRFLSGSVTVSDCTNVPACGEVMIFRKFMQIFLCTKMLNQTYNCLKSLITGGIRLL